MKKKIMLITILFLTIGFAAVTTTLVINVNSTIGTNEGDFDVYFSSAIIDSEDYSNKVISSDRLSIDYTTKDLTYKGDTSILEYEVTNASKNYDANVVVTCTGENELVTITHSPENQIIEATSIGTGNVIVTLNKTVTEETELEFTCTLNVNAVERENLGENDLTGANTYALVGKYVDESGNTLSNANLVIYSENPIYITTDSAGNVYYDGLTGGSYELYYINDSLENIKLMSKNEIIENSISNSKFTTTTKGDLVFEDNSKIINSSITKSSNYCENLVGRTFEYSYTGTEQRFNVPCEGEYKVEVWGASGGDAYYYPADVTYDGGHGGYSAGTILLNQQETIFINVGGKGISTCDVTYCAGGYNGGGRGVGGLQTGLTGYLKTWIGASGGGATHLAKSSGVLSSLENKKNQIIIVAGGGGGGFVHRYGGSSNHWRGYGGAGGGLTSEIGLIPVAGRSSAPTAATQTSPGYGYDGKTYFASGSFGQGQNAPDNHEKTYGAVSGGGGGYYGGGASVFVSTSGGSSYIDGVENGETLSGSKSMPSYDGTSTMLGNSGNGYAKITVLSLS